MTRDGGRLVVTAREAVLHRILTIGGRTRIPHCVPEGRAGLGVKGLPDGRVIVALARARSRCVILRTSTKARSVAGGGLVARIATVSSVTPLKEGRPPTVFSGGAGHGCRKSGATSGQVEGVSVRLTIQVVLTGARRAGSSGRVKGGRRKRGPNRNFVQQVLIAVAGRGHSLQPVGRGKRPLVSTATPPR